MTGAVSGTVLDGSLLLAVPIAVAAGLVSFLSPCVLPLVPGYLGYVTGLAGVEPDRERRWRLVAGTALFVAGFSAVFILLGVVAGAVGHLLLEYTGVLTRVLGVLTIGLGLLFAGILPGWRLERRPGLRPAAGLAGAPLLGAVFGLSWTACTGPTLGAILALGGSVGASPARGALLAAAYCVGLGLPFLLAALAYRRAMRTFDVVRRHRVAVTRAGGVLLVTVGLMLVSGVWLSLMAGIRGGVTEFVPVL